jgi:hypothetical protein
LIHAGHIGIFEKKRVSRDARSKIRLFKKQGSSKNKAPPPAEPYQVGNNSTFANNDRLISATEEQPQQNDHWNRHAQKPEQNSSSHHRLLEISIDSRTPEAMRGSSESRGKAKSHQ